MDHPFHFHGHNFIVLKLGSKKELEKPDFYKVTGNNEYPLVRDVVLIPASGFVVFRFVADNPGKNASLLEISSRKLIFFK